MVQAFSPCGVPLMPVAHSPTFSVHTTKSFKTIREKSAEYFRPALRVYNLFLSLIKTAASALKGDKKIFIHIARFKTVTHFTLVEKVQSLFSSIKGVKKNLNDKTALELLSNIGSVSEGTASIMSTMGVFTPMSPPTQLAINTLGYVGTVFSLASLTLDVRAQRENTLYLASLKGVLSKSDVDNIQSYVSALNFLVVPEKGVEGKSTPSDAEVSAALKKKDALLSKHFGMPGDKLRTQIVKISQAANANKNTAEGAKVLQKTMDTLKGRVTTKISSGKVQMAATLIGLVASSILAICALTALCPPAAAPLLTGLASYGLFPVSSILSCGQYLHDKFKTDKDFKQALEALETQARLSPAKKSVAEQKDGLLAEAIEQTQKAAWISSLVASKT